MPEKYLDKNGLSHLWSKIPKEQVWVGSEEPTGDQTVWIDPTGSETAGLVTQAELANKQDKLTAGTNITIDSNNVISATSGSGGSSGGVSGYAFTSTQTFTDADKAHLKEIYTNKNIYMTIDNLTVVRIMSMGSRWGFVVINTNGATSNQVLVYTVDLDSSGNVTSNTFTLFMSYYLAGNSSALSGDIITSENWSQYISAGGLIGKSMDGFNQPESEWGWIADWAQHPEKYYVVVKGITDTNRDCPVIYTAVYGDQFSYYWFEDSILHAQYIKFTDNTLSQVESVSQYIDAGTVWLTEQNWNQYITAGGGSDWHITTSTSDGNLYNAKEVVIFWQDSNYNRHQSYLNVGCGYYGNSGQTWGSSNWVNTQITLDGSTQAGISYDGSNVNTTNMASIDAICYKT